VARGGGSDLSVVINNYSGSNVQARKESQALPDGSALERLIVDVAGESLDGGHLANIGKSRFGWTENIG